MKQPTMKQILLEEAQARFKGIQFQSLDYPEQSEAAYILKTQFKFSRQQIADFMGLTHRTVMTRLHTYKLFVGQGRIPSGKFNFEVAEPALEAIMLDEVERQNRAIATKQSNIFLRGDILEQRLVAACAPNLP